MRLFWRYFVILDSIQLLGSLVKFKSLIVKPECAYMSHMCTIRLCNLPARGAWISERRKCGQAKVLLRRLGVLLGCASVPIMKAPLKRGSFKPLKPRKRVRPETEQLTLRALPLQKHTEEQVRSSRPTRRREAIPFLSL
ncbi:hypothetical protein TcCL_ESM06602 [Trypanosoma cruzi]|nr:hypothetical protein TcCL_ESM06602 [Trypanosoma cruzi]